MYGCLCDCSITVGISREAISEYYFGVVTKKLYQLETGHWL